jgi:hypothetical protein
MRELSCPAHPAGYVRRYRTNGPEGPGVYPQCVPGDGSPTHILTWEEASAEHGHTADVAAEACVAAVLRPVRGPQGAL